MHIIMQLLPYFHFNHQVFICSKDFLRLFRFPGKFPPSGWTRCPVSPDQYHFFRSWSYYHQSKLFILVPWVWLEDNWPHSRTSEHICLRTNLDCLFTTLHSQARVFHGSDGTSIALGHLRTALMQPSLELPSCRSHAALVLSVRWRQSIPSNANAVQSAQTGQTLASSWTPFHYLFFQPLGASGQFISTR